MDPDVIQSILGKNPLLQRQKEKLEAMTAGRYCYHNTFGFGIIRQFDHATGKLVIDFKNRPDHRINPEFALKHLQILPEEHIIAQYSRDAERILQLMKKDPAAVIQIILTHKTNQRATFVEINEILSAILEPKELKSWWTKARKLIDSDPKIAIPESKTGYYILRECPIAPLDELIDSIIVSKKVAQKITYATKLLKEIEGEEPDVAKLEAVQEDLANLMRSPSLSECEHLQLYWLQEELAEMTKDSQWLTEDLGALLRRIHDLDAVANALSSIYLTRLLKSLSEMTGEGFLQHCFHLLKNGTSRTIGIVIDFLIKNQDSGLQILRDTFEQWVRENGFRPAILEWIIRNRKNKKYVELLTGLVTPTFFRLALNAIDQEALRRSSNRKIALAETLANDRELVGEVLGDQPIGIAKDLAHMLLHNQGFDILTKKSMLARFIRIFPSLQKLLEANGPRRDTSLKVSEESLERVRHEYDLLVHEKIPANKRAIETAREHGDLRENSEYKMARQDQDILMARKAQIERELEVAQVVDFTAVGCDHVGLGSVVTLRDGKTKKEKKMAILGAWDSNPKRNIIAYQTPFGQLLMNKKVGDEVQIEGQPVQQIEKIERWVDCSANWK